MCAPSRTRGRRTRMLGSRHGGANTSDRSVSACPIADARLSTVLRTACGPMLYMPRTDAPRLPNYRTLVDAAWREQKVNASVAGSATDPMLGAARPPAGFIAVELGFGVGEGPSLQVTLLHLERGNRTRRKLLSASEKKQRTKRETPEMRQRRLLDLTLDGLMAAQGRAA